MKRLDFIKLLEDNGWHFLSHGARHDLYTNGKRKEAVGRHNELDDDLVKKICKRNNIAWRKI
jgi:predicted RNA binding protein YcfA (HicA-like mRNA interferase family)